jgi:Double zinc ribbon domain
MQADGLRPIVEALDREMSRRLARGNVDGADTSALLAAWAKLVEFLALGAPAPRECPFCGSIAMRAATLCGICWRKLEPPAPVATA